jgi:hypothetical protein
MRTLSAALLAKQIAVSVVPYVKFNLTSADGNTVLDYTTRVLNIEHHEESYNDYATVVLRNDDRGVASDLRGYWVQIAYGFVTGNNVADSEGSESAGNNAGAEYSYTPRLWVKSQQEISKPGMVRTVLELEGMWVVLRELQWITDGEGPPTFYYKEYTTDTAYAITGAILTKASFTLDAVGDQSDGIIDVITPAFVINGSDVFSGFDTYAGLIYRLLTMTKCYLRAKTGLAFKVVYPQVSDTVKKTYYSAQQHIFTEYLERKKLLTSNHIYVLWGDNSTAAVPISWTNWLWTAGHAGEALDSAEISAYRSIVEVVTAGELQTEAAADIRAGAILTRRKSELLSGHLVIRHDCAIELYDRIAIIDTRGGGSVTFPSDTLTRVSGLVHRYAQGIYSLEVFLGDTRTDWSAFIPEVTPTPTLVPPTKIPYGPPIPKGLITPATPQGQGEVVVPTPTGGGASGGSGATGSWNETKNTAAIKENIRIIRNVDRNITE